MFSRHRSARAKVLPLSPTLSPTGTSFGRHQGRGSRCAKANRKSLFPPALPLARGATNLRCSSPLPCDLRESLWDGRRLGRGVLSTPGLLAQAAESAKSYRAHDGSKRANTDKTCRSSGGRSYHCRPGDMVFHGFSMKSGGLCVRRLPALPPVTASRSGKAQPAGFEKESLNGGSVVNGLSTKARVARTPPRAESAKACR